MQLTGRRLLCGVVVAVIAGRGHAVREPFFRAEPSPFRNLPEACASGSGKAVVEGRVLDDSAGAPVSGIRIFTEPHGCPAHFLPDGGFYFAGLAPGSYTLVISRPAAAKHGRFLQLEPPEVHVASGDRLTVDIHLVPRPCHASGPTGRVSGSVVDDSAGVPVPLALVVLEGTTCHAYSDSAGRFAIYGVAADTVALTIRRLGLRFERLGGVVVPPGGVADVELRTRAEQVRLMHFEVSDES